MLFWKLTKKECQGNFKNISVVLYPPIFRHYIPALPLVHSSSFPRRNGCYQSLFWWKVEQGRLSSLCNFNKALYISAAFKVHTMSSAADFVLTRAENLGICSLWNPFHLVLRRSIDYWLASRAYNFFTHIPS